MINQTAIIILNYKNYSDTIQCIESILQYTNSNDMTIFAVDNNSGNDSLKHIEEAFKSKIAVELYNGATPQSKIVLVQNDKNFGYAFGNNVGLKVAHSLGYKYLMVLNNDTLFIEDSLTKLRKILEGDNLALCSGPLLLKGDKVSIDYNCAKRRPTYLDIFRVSYFGKWLQTEAWKKRYYYTKKYPNLANPIKVDIISGSCMLFDAQKFSEIGFFEDTTFLYYEEAIVAEKGRQKGYSMVFEPNARVVHLGAQTTKTQSSSLFTLKCEYDSLKIYLKKYRKVSGFTFALVSLSNYLFIKAYAFKNKTK